MNCSRVWKIHYIPSNDWNPIGKFFWMILHTNKFASYRFRISFNKFNGKHKNITRVIKIILFDCVLLAKKLLSWLCIHWWYSKQITLLLGLYSKRNWTKLIGKERPYDHLLIHQLTFLHLMLDVIGICQIDFWYNVLYCQGEESFFSETIKCKLKNNSEGFIAVNKNCLKKERRILVKCEIDHDFVPSHRCADSDPRVENCHCFT